MVSARDNLTQPDSYQNANRGLSRKIINLGLALIRASTSRHSKYDSLIVCESVWSVTERVLYLFVRVAIYFILFSHMSDHLQVIDEKGR